MALGPVKDVTAQKEHPVLIPVVPGIHPPVSGPQEALGLLERRQVGGWGPGERLFNIRQESHAVFSQLMLPEGLNIQLYKSEIFYKSSDFI